MADEDEAKARAAEWAAAQEAKTEQVDGVPELVEVFTPRPEHTGRHRMTPAMFASGIELAERDGFERGLKIGAARERAQAQADAVTEHRKVREDVIDTFRALWVIFEIRFPSWPEAEKWARSRMTPL